MALMTITDEGIITSGAYKGHKADDVLWFNPGYFWAGYLNSYGDEDFQEYIKKNMDEIGTHLPKELRAARMEITVLKARLYNQERRLEKYIGEEKTGESSELLQ